MQAPDLYEPYISRLRPIPQKNSTRTKSAHQNRTQEMEQYFLIPTSRIDIHKFQRAKSCKCSKCDGKGVKKADRLLKIAYFYEQHIDLITQYESTPKDISLQEKNKNKLEKDKQQIKKQFSEIFPQIKNYKEKCQALLSSVAEKEIPSDKILCPKKPENDYIRKILQSIRNQNFEDQKKQTLKLLSKQEKQKKVRTFVQINHKKRQDLKLKEQAQLSFLKRNQFKVEEEIDQVIKEKQIKNIEKNKRDVQKASRTILEIKRERKNSNMLQSSQISTIRNQECLTQDFNKRFEDLRLKFNSNSVKNLTLGINYKSQNQHSTRDLHAFPMTISHQSITSKNSSIFFEGDGARSNKEHFHKMFQAQSKKLNQDDNLYENFVQKQILGVYKKQPSKYLKLPSIKQKAYQRKFHLKNAKD